MQRGANEILLVLLSSFFSFQTMQVLKFYTKNLRLGGDANVKFIVNAFDCLLRIVLSERLTHQSLFGFFENACNPCDPN